MSILNQGTAIISDSPNNRQPNQIEKSLEQACLCARVADEYRGNDVVVLDMTQITPHYDYFVIATGNNRRQMHAIAEEVDRVLSKQGSKRMGIEGYDDSTWILQDYGDIVLQLFTEETREYYRLEELWADATVVDWQQTSANPPQQ